MSLIRINEFVAAPGKAAALRSFLEELVPFIRSSSGCKGVELASCLEDGGRFVVVETWDSKESHAASLANYPRERMEAGRQLIGAPPKGEFFERSEFE